MTLSARARQIVAAYDNPARTWSIDSLTDWAGDAVAILRAIASAGVEIVSVDGGLPFVQPDALAHGFDETGGAA